MFDCVPRLTIGEVISRISSNFAMPFGFNTGISLRLPQNSYSFYNVFYLSLVGGIIEVRNNSNC